MNLTSRINAAFRHAPIWIAEHAVRDLAIPAAVLSTTGGPGYLNKITAGVTTPVKMLYDIGHAYLYDTGFRQTVNSFFASSAKAIGQFGDNIANRPDETLYAALMTYAGFKILPAVSRSLRRRYIK
ncbi:hypothetical protein J4458_00940 [Candidatus Woesearchaeota archaeon]|nr:hypothetical protein [Candidatus Woesearchaeota archaeon]